ncbi:MAG: FABP family protein, partial [Gemmatimonadota bacterium]
MPPSLEPLAFLIGSWRGEGEGEYPGVEPFRYTEELSFQHVGDPFLLVTESSWTPEGAPLHFERGTLRPLGDGRVDLALAHPIGVAEVAEGTVDGTNVTLHSTAVVRTATGSPVTEIGRRYRMEGDHLSYELDMAMEGVARTFHVR